MRRKSDMFRDLGDGDNQPFLPAESEQAASLELQRLRERLATVEDQLKSQFTSIATYAAISQQTVETARAEARADLDREKATLVRLLEQVRAEAGAAPATAARPLDAAPAADDTRLQLLEERFERLQQQFTEILQTQEELANSISFLVEHQMRAAGWVATCADPVTG